jgi:hypothetical protein
VARKAVDSILKRGEDERDVKNGMTSFTNFKSFWRGHGRGRGLRVGFRLCLSCSCKG